MQDMGMLFMLAHSNPELFARIAGLAGLPLPNSQEFGDIMNPTGLGGLLSPEMNVARDLTSPMTMAQAQPPTAGSPSITPPASIPGLTTPPPAVPEGGPEVNTGDLMSQLMGPDIAGAVAGQQPKAPGQPQAPAGPRWPQVRMPTPPTPEFRAGVAGAQKAPDTHSPTKPGATPAQALLAALMGGRGQKGMQVPALGALLHGGG